MAEKQSVARELARHLAGGAFEGRRVSGQAVSDFPFQLDGLAVQMTVTAVRGHLMELDFADPALKSWTASDPSALFSAQIKQSVNNAEIARCLAQLARAADWLVLWLDCDREGEAIAFEVLEVCRSANPRLRVSRARFSALTAADLRRACATLTSPNTHLSEAVLARSEIDLRIGAAFTRFLSLRFSGVGGTKLVSFGPCQFPTLGFVVARYLAINRFQSEPFWSLKLRPPLQAFCWNRTRLFDLQTVEALHAICTQEAVVTKFLTQPKIRRRPLPLNTLELTKAASSHLRLASHRCMQIAEQLYSKGFISYPRTETDGFHSSIDLRALVALHAGHSTWGSFAARLITGEEFTVPRSGNRNDQAHPPIHPLKSLERSEFESDDEWRVFEFVTRHFLACCAPDAIGSNTHVEIRAGELFHTDGLIVLERNWLEVYPYTRWGGGGGEVPNCAVGDLLEVRGVDIVHGQTEPPNLLSEEELIDLMDRHGIGTDATMHEHIKTVQDRGYCGKDASAKFHPSPLGIALVVGFSAYANLGIHLAKPSLRAEMESDMGRIANGTLSRNEFIQKYVALMRGVFLAVSDNPYFMDLHVRGVTGDGGDGVGRRGRGGGRGRGSRAPTSGRPTRPTGRRARNANR